MFASSVKIESIVILSMKTVELKLGVSAVCRVGLLEELGPIVVRTT